MENTNILYKLEVDYQGTVDYLLFTTSGIFIPKFLSNRIIGSKKQFFIDNKILTYLDNSYFLDFNNISGVIINRKTNKIYEIKFIAKEESKNHTIVNLSKINEKQFQKIYEIIKKYSHIDVPSLDDIEFSAQVVLQGRVIKLFAIMALTAISSLLISFELIGGTPEKYNYLSIIALIVSGCFFLSLALGIIWYSSLKNEAKERRHKRITLILIISEILFLAIVGFVFVFGFTR